MYLYIIKCISSCACLQNMTGRQLNIFFLILSSVTRFFLDRRPKMFQNHPLFSYTKKLVYLLFKNDDNFWEIFSLITLIRS
jgi:hypothetical protein